MIAGGTDEPLLGTQRAPKRAPLFNCSRTAGGGGSGDHAALKKAESSLTAAQDADLSQNFIDELAQEVQSRRKERDQKKPIGARLDSASAATKRAKAAWESAREVPGSRGRRCGGGGRAA